MLPKPSGRRAMKVVKGFVIVELLGLFGVYYLYRTMDSSRDFRSTMSRRFPSVLEVYYQCNERAGILGIREGDHKAWSANQD